MIGSPLRTDARARARRPRSLVALALSAALVLAGCTGGSEDGASDEPGAQSTADGTTLSGTWPLTGRTVKGAAPEHPVTVVKIDNTTSSRPQIGLSNADLVVEELVEGGSTRLAAFFYSRLPKKVGPVRSMRTTDIGIVKPAKAVLVASGGAGPTVRKMRRADVRTRTEGSTGFSRDSTRTSPYDLFMNLARLGSKLEPTDPPQNYLPWGSAKEFPSGRKARGLRATFSAGHTTTWELRGGTYADPDSNAASGDQFRPDTVVVLRVKVGDAGYKDPAGNPVPETRLTGSGDALVFHDGRVVRGTWTKRGLADQLDFRTEAGPLSIPAGNVWIELVPTNGGDVSVVR